MEKNNRIKNLLTEGCDLLGIDLNDQVLSLLVRYFLELDKWNRKINLVGRAPERTIIEKHFLDSLTLLPFLRQNSGLPLLDVGSGGGFPALALKTCLPELALTLVEPRRKRTAFLKHIIRTLGLKKATVIDSRLAMANPLFQKKTFPLISCRGLANISEIIELCQPFSLPGGRVICMKGPKAEKEMNEWREKQPDSPFFLEEQINCSLPFSQSKRAILIFGVKRSNI